MNSDGSGAFPSRPLVGPLVSVLLAACLQPTNPTPATPGLDPTACRIDCGSGLSGLWDNVTMSDCTGYQHNFVQPKSSVFQAEFPPPLRSDGGASNSAGLQNWACKQAVVNGQIVDNLEFAYFYTLISNPDIKERRNSHVLVFTVYSNSPLFIETARPHGLNVTLAPNFGPVSRTPLGASLDDTSFVYPSDTKHFTFRGIVDHTAGSDWEWTRAIYFPFEGKIRRLLYTENGKVDSGNEGVMEFGPDSYWGRHSKANHIDDGVNYSEHAVVTLSFDNTWALNMTAAR